ncbi:MAG: winged helix-turn-helix transcriptional regulator [Firmicutes bacterium]|nr:winged helix-turn-helix transcriptional regulator [Bacillota bacterium]
MNVKECHDCYFQFLSFEKTFRQFTQSKIKGCDLTLGHLMIMSYLYENGDCGQKELTVTFNSSSAAMAVSIARLEEEGIVCKMTDAEDKRNNNISLTEKGRSYLLSFSEKDGIKPEERTDGICEFISKEELYQLTRLQKKLFHQLKAIVEKI